MDWKVIFISIAVTIIVVASAAGIWVYGDRKYHAGYNEALKRWELDHKTETIILWKEKKRSGTVKAVIRDQGRFDGAQRKSGSRKQESVDSGQWLVASDGNNYVAVADTNLDNDLFNLHLEYHSTSELKESDFFKFDINYKYQEIFERVREVKCPETPVKTWLDRFHLGAGLGIGVAAAEGKLVAVPAVTMGVFYEF